MFEAVKDAILGRTSENSIFQCVNPVAWFYPAFAGRNLFTQRDKTYLGEMHITDPDHSGVRISRGSKIFHCVMGTAATGLLVFVGVAGINQVKKAKNSPVRTDVQLEQYAQSHPCYGDVCSPLRPPPKKGHYTLRRFDGQK